MKEALGGLRAVSAFFKFMKFKNYWFALTLVSTLLGSLPVAQANPGDSIGCIEAYRRVGHRREAWTEATALSLALVASAAITPVAAPLTAGALFAMNRARGFHGHTQFHRVADALAAIENKNLRCNHDQKVIDSLIAELKKESPGLKDVQNSKIESILQQANQKGYICPKRGFRKQAPMPIYELAAYLNRQTHPTAMH